MTRSRWMLVQLLVGICIVKMIVLPDIVVAVGATMETMKSADGDTILMLPLNNLWKFRPDPENRGEVENWASPGISTGNWVEMRSDLGKGWESQGFESFVGVGWYRQTVEIPEELARMKHVWIMFGAVDLECEVYVNGERAYAHTRDTSFVDHNMLWRAPFAFDAKKWLKPGTNNVIAVRVEDKKGMAGIWKPAFVFGCEGKHGLKELHDLVVSRKLMKPFDKGWHWLDPAYYEIPPIAPHPQETLLGARIQRTMSLLATSNDRIRRTVRILFYGQSIVAGLPWKSMIAELQERYPHANIVAENRAIGGQTAPYLVRFAVHDLYPFYPDLVVFNVGAGETTGELERIVHNIRKYTTAEIIMYTHTVSSKPSADFPTDGPSTDVTSCQRRFLAQKYGCEFVEVRDEWLQYLRENNIPPSEFMYDTVHPSVHPNRRGNKLFSSLLLRHFRFNTFFPCGWYNTVKTYEARRALEEKADEIELIGKGWTVDEKHEGVVTVSKGTRLRLAFVGNRVDVVTMPIGGEYGTATVKIDGAKPSSFAGCYACTRPEPTLSLRRVTIGPDPLVEEWVLTFTELSKNNADRFAYEVVGSVTGPDGKGDNQGRFVSKSGRITIEPEDFSGLASLTRATRHAIGPGMQIKWRVVPMFVDTWNPGATAASPDRTCTLVQGLENKTHTLEIIPNGDGPIPIKAVVVYEPPLK